MHAFVLFEFTTQPAARERAKRYVYEGLKSGALKPIIDPKVFTLDQIVDDTWRAISSSARLW